MLVGFFALHSMTSEAMRAENKDYPSLSQRLRIIVQALDLPEEHEFWLFGSSVLREMHRDSDYAIVGVNSETKSPETFLSLAERDFR
jgi:predicted nucleotidyltransferase